MLSDVPSFLQQVSSTTGQITASTVSPGVHSDQACLQNQIYQRLETMKGLRETWHAKYTNPVWQTSPKMTPPTTPVGDISPNFLIPPFQTVLYFTDMYRAYDLCIYNTTLILLIMLYEQVSHDLDPLLQYPSPALQALFPTTSPHSLIRDICRCTEYMLLEEHGSRGYIVLMFPATIAFFASEKDSLEAKWLRDVCKRHAGSSGFGFGDLALDQPMPLNRWTNEWKTRFRSAYHSSRSPEMPCRQRPFKPTVTRPFEHTNAQVPPAVSQTMADTPPVLACSNGTCGSL